METAAAGSTAAAVPPPAAVGGGGGYVSAYEAQSGVGSGSDRPRSASIASLVSEADTENEDLTSEEVKAEVIAAFPFLEGELDNVVVICTASDAAGVSWTNPGAVNQAFKPQAKKSTKQIPLSVIQDSASLSAEAKALLVSYWRGLSASGMKDVTSELKKVYASYTVGNGKKKGGSSSSSRKRKRTNLDLDSMEKFDGGLSGDHAFVEQYNIELGAVAKVVNEQAVVGLDLTQPSTIKEVFKAKDFPGCGGRQMPMAIILDCSNDRDRLIVGNWWRSLSKEDQDLQWKKMQAFYRAPTNTNDRLIVGTAAAAAALGLPQHVGAANDQETLNKAASVSANFRTAQTQKRRKLSDPATSTAQKWDKKVRTKFKSIMAEVNNFNTTTSSDEKANLAGRTSSILVVETDVATPPRQGHHGMDKAIRGKPKTFVVARSMDSVERQLGPIWVDWKKGQCDVYFSFDLEHQLQLEADEEARKRVGVQAAAKNQQDMENEYEETDNIVHMGEVDGTDI